MKPIDVAKLILRFLVGGMFISTAILKLISIEEFELYIYSFDIFNYVIVAVLSRFLIAFEFLLGIFLILKIHYKYVWGLTMLTMIGFTLFLCYVALFRNDANCHCFGEFVELDPISSIVKNIVTIVLLLLIRKENDCQYGGRKWLRNLLLGLGISAAAIIPFTVQPMDGLYAKLYASEDGVNLTAFEALKMDTTLHNFSVEDGDYMLAFVISGCKYCKIGMKKINSIVEKHDLEHAKIKIMIAGSEQNIENFKELTGIEDYPIFPMSPITSIRVVNGSFPTYVYVKDGEVQKSIDMKGIDENELVNFLQK